MKQVNMLADRLDELGAPDEGWSGAGGGGSREGEDEYSRAAREHKMEMLRLKNEAERIKTQNELEELRRSSEEEKKKAQSDREHREWLEDQARKLQQAKVAKKVAIAKGGDEAAGDGDLSNGASYSSVEGYQIYFDNVLGLPGKVNRVGLVFCFYDRSEQKIQVKSVPSVDTDRDGENTKQAVFGLRRQFKNVPPSATLRCVVEVQKIISIPKSPNEQPKVQSLAWCVVPLFVKDADGATVLNVGSWRVPCYRPQVDPNIHTPESLAQIRQRVEPLDVYLRICCAADTPAQDTQGCNIGLTKSRYRWAPGYGMRDELKPEERQKSKRRSPSDDVSDDYDRETPYTDSEDPTEAGSPTKSPLGESRGAASSRGTLEQELENAEELDMKLTLEGSVDEFDRDAFLEDMAAELDVHPDRFEGVDVIAGSIIVKFKVRRDETEGATSLPAVHRRMGEIHQSRNGLGGYQLREFRSQPAGRTEAQSGAMSAAIFGKKLQSRAESKNPDHWQREDTPSEGGFVDDQEALSPQKVQLEEGYSPDRGLGILVRRAEDTQPDGSVYIKVTVTNNGVRVTRDDMGAMDPEEWRSTSTQMGKKLGVLEWEERQVLCGIEQSEGVRLVFELFESSLGVEDSIGWCACSPFKGGGDNEVNQGSQTLSVYKYPLKLPPVDVVGFGKSTLIVECFDPATPPSIVQVDVADGAELSSDAWVMGMPAAPPRVPWDPEDATAGVDLYIDGGRFFPDCVTASKVTIYLMDKDGGMVAGPFERMCMADRSAYEPVYCLRKELRNAKSLEYSTTIFVQIDTVEAQSKDRRVVGYAVHHLFCEPDTTDQATSATCRLNAGNFQVPLHISGIGPGEPVMKSALDHVPRVPCATLLLRIVPAVTDKDGLRIINASDVSKEEAMSLGIIKPPPKYRSGAYDASSCVPDAREKGLYSLWLERTPAVVKDLLIELADVSQKAEMTKNGKIDSRKLDRYAHKLLKKPPLTNDMPMRLSFFSKYIPEQGFSVSVDGCQNLPTEGKYVSVITSLSPPGLYYRDMPLTEGVQITRGLDLESEQVNPKFPKEGSTKLYKDIDPDPNLVLIVDVRAFKDTGDKKTEQVGWTLLSLFTEDGYCRTGNYQIPLFKGKVKTGILEELKKKPLSEVWPAWLSGESTSESGDRIKLLQPSSVFVRLCDAKLGDSILTPFENPEASVLPDNLTRDEYLQKEHSPKCVEMVPAGSSDVEYLKRMDKKFSELTDLVFDV